MARILVVDDDPITLELLRVSLSLANHNVTVSQDPLDFKTLLEQHDPEAVILDINLPGLSGYDLLKQLRTLPKHESVPVLFLSGLASLKDRIKGLKSSADDYLSKPFDPEELTLRVEKLLAVHRRLRGSSDIQGSLKVYSLPDLLQVLQRDQRTGVITLSIGMKAVGFVFLREGVIVSAEYGSLTRSDAVLEMIDQPQGAFSFKVKKPHEIRTSFPPSLTLQNLLLMDVHFRDEITRISTKGIDWKARWWLDLDDKEELVQPEDLPPLPFECVLKALQEHPGSFFEDLSAHCGLARVRLGLTLVSLWKQNFISPKEPLHQN